MFLPTLVAITALSLWAASHIFRGLKFDSTSSLVVSALLLGFANAIVKPLLIVLTLPLTLLTFGLFLLVINALMVLLVSALVKGFRVSGFWTAFFASIFSYSQRKRLCAAAYEKTRRNLAERAAVLEPQLAKHGITLRRDRVQDASRRIADALTDPRPLNVERGQSGVRQTTRDLSHTLDHLERWLATAR